ncbi:putative membrane protein [Candidatus Ichthyocystis hellenicum]|uniref:Putative membrane protein n=1 Tax=Candidatus Ichthyocystis hellenicum TaxID=1561003 RepID=A0A0S4M5P7_9BURK|nr:putative membrane protein [Candidatus Ichthyocystis hellenicum]
MLIILCFITGLTAELLLCDMIFINSYCSLLFVSNVNVYDEIFISKTAKPVHRYFVICINVISSFGKFYFKLVNRMMI